MDSISFIYINGKGSSGKDTQADIILEKLGEKAIKLSTGEIYRDAKDGIGEYGKYHYIIEPFINHVDKQGGLLPDSVIVNIVKEIIIEKTTEEIETFIFTGFPRTKGQLELMDELTSSIENSHCLFIHYDISDETSRERAKNRRLKAEEAGLSIRPDDQEEVVEKRLKTFRELTYPMLLKLDTEGRLINIDAEGTIQNIERETSNRISKERR
jgi:adenylate kinase